MSLFEEHKAERRARILAAARELVAERGYAGLTMRDLAQASRVSVPTLYNLFGGKQGLLLGELQEIFTAVVQGLEQARARSFVERALATCDAGDRALLAAPGHSRELILLFLTTSDETGPLRRATAEQYTDLMAGILRDGRAAGELADWVDPSVLSRRMFAHYTQAMIEWAQGELDADEFHDATRFGLCAMLLGFASGAAVRELRRRLEALQTSMTTARRPRRRARKGE